MSNNWKDRLKDFKNGAEEALGVPVEGPPCLGCKHWKPQRTYMLLNGGPSQYSDVNRHYDEQVFDGVRLCWSLDQFHDFSCFEDKSENS
jgi:hypothetical protein